MASMMLGDQLLVGKIAGVDNPPQRVTEDVRVGTVVESPLQFLQVAVHVLAAHLVESADDGSLEQAPHSLDPVSVNFADDPLLGGVAHRLMAGVLVIDSDVGFQLVSVDGLGLGPDVSFDEVMQGMTPDVGDALDPDLPGVSLDGSGNPGFAFLTPRADIGPLPADQGFVHFHDAKQGRPLEGIVTHGFADSVTEIPGGAVGYSQGAVELIGAHTLFGFAHEVDGEEPLAKRQVGVVHDRSRGHGELVPAVLAPPLVLSSFGHSQATAPDTGDPIRPAQFLKGVGTGFVATETINDGD